LIVLVFYGFCPKTDVVQGGRSSECCPSNSTRRLPREGDVMQRVVLMIMMEQHQRGSEESNKLYDEASARIGILKLVEMEG
jgi:hypothetical protein